MMSRQHEIRIKVSKEEYDNIKLNAEILNMQIAPYIRMVAQNPNIIRFNYRAVEDHTRMLGRIVQSINRLVYTIYLNNDYQPKEIEGIVEYIKHIWETENELLEEVRNQWIKADKLERKCKCGKRM
jgi:hypothetical protein